MSALNYQINFSSIFKKMHESKKIEKQFTRIAEDDFNQAKKILLAQFLQHPVTKEIMGGPLASNVSGCVSKGNLFSFIGFEVEENPAKDLYDYLNQNIRFYSTPKKYFGKDFKYSFAIKMPTRKDFIRHFPLPWNQGKSWPISIENGIPNIGYYLFLFNEIRTRSQHGVQLKQEIKNQAKSIFRPHIYLSAMFDDFQTNLKGYKKGNYMFDVQ